MATSIASALRSTPASAATRSTGPWSGARATTAPWPSATLFPATEAVAGVDGRKRRWVYLHYFKGGQPTFNWLDPTFAAQRLVIGDALHSLGTLGESMLRLDANGFLGIEVGSNNDRAWSEGHP